ncbi:bifunctional 5,10-methylenetetrahydrofolate dehydrogenase/5,10-methenyltetrahydrofolate cyclohydrolase [Fimbriimonas ginsengisoli]|uniref:Bifunctional protein FolD n=1 Tax=Fimbriimonas ginsengisoli Gsoil 348 TaxID=661478 RepID=A0A068NVL4_FIMGI|nr:bifunctional 5,10-methylenetetrahydrofolate dehydrogenase/5,10-methenyltetrahydrofolate cyclohydrolase [Fimbriimonas ginsengisoli]AIE86835.1 methenyltetrahydrofolate cyclohydrolase [Fimbriimonas ginsengisoli Gsoil 348]
MSAQILDGLALSKETRARLKERVDALVARGVTPRLDVLVAAQDPASVKYVQMKRKWCAQVGIVGESYEITETTSQADLIGKIRELNADPHVHGILLQHPLPGHLDENMALMELGAEKDVDGITPQSLGRLVADLPGFRCATPLGIIRLLEHYGIETVGKRAVVIGRSIILGKPAALMLLQKNATVTIAHSRTQNLADICREADIVVAAVGRPEMVAGDWIKPGAVVVDAGYNRVEGRKGDVGDVAFESASQVAGWITPVPGGVGPMTVASLLSNCVEAAEATITNR